MTELKVPEWALKEDGSPGNTIAPKLGMEQEYLAKLASERYDKILQLERELAEEKNHSGAALSRISTREQQLAAKDAEIEALKAEVESLVRSIDEEMVSCHIGVFERGDDPKKAINELMAWSQGVGEYFSKDKANHYYVANTKLTEEIAALKAEVERLKQELAQPWKHSEHWRNPETGQVECECCCSWALDCEKEHKELVTLREQVERLSAPLTHKEWKKNFILNATDDVYSEDKDGFDGVIAARLEGK